VPAVYAALADPSFCTLDEVRAAVKTFPKKSDVRATAPTITAEASAVATLLADRVDLGGAVLRELATQPLDVVRSYCERHPRYDWSEVDRRMGLATTVVPHMQGTRFVTPIMTAEEARAYQEKRR
jgi:hypothetical protein